MHGSTVRNNSPPRPGSTGNLAVHSSQVLSPYLLGGLSNVTDSRNSQGKVVQQRISKHEAAAVGATLAAEGSSNAVVADEKEFTSATDGLERTLQDLRKQLEVFDPLNRGRAGSNTYTKRRSADDDDDAFEKLQAMRERFEAYKMVRRIEPDLPPL